MNQAILIIFLFVSTLVYSQQPILPERDYPTSSNFDKSNFERTYQMAVYNAAFNGLVGGIGAAIHHKPEQRTIDAFLKGFYKGAISSVVMSTGKTMAGLIFSEENYAYGWPAKITNSLGASMLENTIQNKPLFSNYGIDLVFIRVDVNSKVQVRLMPYHTAMFIGSRFVVKDVSVNWKASLLTGTLSYKIDNPAIHPLGFATNNVIYVDHITAKPFEAAGYNLFSSYYTYAHETIHAFQDRNYGALNYLWFKEKNKFFFWDIPVYDILAQPTQFMTRNNENLYSNPFEYEANYSARFFLSYSTLPVLKLMK